MRHGILFLTASILLILSLQVEAAEKQYYRNNAEKIRLTDIEKAWISDHPKIRVGFPSDFPPLFYNEDGILKGINPDHLKLISTYSGLKFDFITIPAKKLNSYLQNGTIDMSVGFEIPGRENVMLNTLPSMKINFVVVGRNDMPVVSGISGMKGKAIAIVRGIEIYNKILKAYPNLQTYPVNSLKEAMEAVMSKKADALMGGMLMVGHLLYEYPSLKILGPVGTPPEPYSYLVTNAFPELVGIMDKTIKIIPKEDVDAIIQKWFKVQIEQKTNWIVILKWTSILCIIFTIIVLSFYYWNKKLSLEIKERRQAENALKISKSRLKNIIENSTNLFYSHTVDHKVTFVSPQVRQYLGYEPEEVMKRWTELITDHPMNEKAIELTNEAIRTGKRQPTYELEMLHKSGRKIIVEVREAPVVENGSVTAIVGSLVDITERKEMEKKYQQAQKMESIGQLAGGIAHDFNNILSPILGFTQLSQDEIPDDHPVQENLTDILNGAKRAGDLVKRILHFSRQKEPELKPTILQPVIKETLKLLRSTIPANINLTSDLYENQDPVLCDESEIHELLLNLCTNAYHAMERDQGDIIIGLDKQNPPPELDLTTGEYLCLSVKDNGSGIPESIKDKIFEPYVTTKDVGKGSGLGLSVVYGIVQNFNGGISVESSCNVGTIFRIYLPITDQAYDIEEKDSIRLSSKAGNKHILLVDDEESIVKLGVRALKNHGYRVTGVQDGIQALNLFKVDPEDFDLVVTDMAMPKMTGTELSQKILEIRPDIPVIICSGYSEKLDKEKAKDLKVSKFLNKPLLLTDLIKSAKELLA